MTFDKEKPAKYKYFTSITAHMGKMLSKNKNSLFRSCFIHLTFKTCQLQELNVLLYHLKSLKKTQQYNLCLGLQHLQKNKEAAD